MRRELFTAFAGTIWHSRRTQSRRKFEAWQRKKVTQWLERSLPKVEAYQSSKRRIPDLPITDKATLMANFAHYNQPKIAAADACDRLTTSDRMGDMIIGASTGTTGNRGLFVISEKEQYRWLGTILAKTIADMLWRPQRIAIVLPRNTSLYDSANRTRHLHLRFFNITDGIESWINDFCSFDPTVIVAPPRILRHFAEQDLPLSPQRVFSAAETLDSIDEDVITNRFGGPVRQIYMATEGLFAVSCAHGSLHLAEDSVFFEFEPVTGGLVSPIVTCFRRDTQIMARYRMNDLLRIAARPCPCGSPLRTISEVVGRMDDTFSFEGVLVTPDVMRDAVVQAHPDITDFRIDQTGRSDVLLKLQTTISDIALDRAYTAVRNVFDRRNVAVNVTVQRANLTPDVEKKLRRVRKIWGGD